MDAITVAVDVVAREALLFAAIGMLVGGLDDLLVDVVYAWGRIRRVGQARVSLVTLTPAGTPGQIAILVPAWDEQAVIGAMLRTTLARLGASDYRIFVGAYPNDPGTIAAISDIAAVDGRVLTVVGDRPGPTTKADCLNTLWRALNAADAHGIM